MNRHLKRWIAAAGAASGLFAARRLASRDHLRMVTYHGVDDRHEPLINVDRLQTPSALFQRQIESMARSFRIVSFRDAVDHLRARGVWPDRGLVVTFDDGYRNNLEIAAPLLRRLGVPATFFVTAGFVKGRTQPWWYALRLHLASHAGADAAARIIAGEARLRPMPEAGREHALRAMGVDPGAVGPYPFMTVAECRVLHGMGFDVQCHGDTHASFAGESPARTAEEIRASAAFIRQLGHAPWAMAYPYGHEPVDPGSARKVMAECGITAAVTTQSGRNRPDADVYRLRRQDMHGGYDPAIALALLS